MDHTQNVPTGAVTAPKTRMFGADRFAFQAVIAGAILCLVAIAIWPEQASRFNQEGGLIEMGSALALLAAALVALVRYRGVTRLYIGVVLLLLAERELEADIYAPTALPIRS